MKPHTLVVRRTVRATPERVFHALTDPAQIAQWFVGAPTGTLQVQADVRIGGRYSLEMCDGATTYRPYGEYLVIDPPRKLVFTWSCAGYVDNTVVTFELTPQPDGTEIRITHVLPGDERNTQAHTEGWTWCLTHLAELVSPLLPHKP